MKKRLLATLLSAVLLFCLFATASTAQAEDARQPKIVVSLSSDGNTFDPYAHMHWGSNIDVMALLYEKLANFDVDGSLHWVMVKDWNEVDELTYEFEIFDCIYDTNGNQITADDVVFSIQHLIDVGDGGAVDHLDYVEKVDDYHLIWHCKTPFESGDMTNVATPYIIDQESYEAANMDFSKNPVATGPYKLESYTPGSKVVFSANDDYWMNNLSEEDRASHTWVIEEQNFDIIECNIIMDTASAAMALEKGDIDIADTLDIIDVNFYENDDSISRVDIRMVPPVAFIFNSSSNSICQDVNLRKAICYALDNSAIAEAETVGATATYGMSARMVGAPEDWTTGREYYDYSTEKAAECLAASNYNGEEIVLMYVSGNQADADAAIMIQAELKEVGIKVRLDQLDRSVVNQKKFDPAGGWDFRLESLSGRSDQIATLLKYFTVEENKSHFENNETITMVADEKLNELSLAAIKDSSEENIDAWDDYFTEEMCYGYAICTYTSSTAAKSNVTVAQGTKDRIYPNACVIG